VAGQGRSEINQSNYNSNIKVLSKIVMETRLTREDMEKILDLLLAADVSSDNLNDCG
jgi:hypothetical protein